jgi:capsular exopolysaccharide synthesis family protein
LLGRRGRERFVGSEMPEGRAAESFRTLRTSLMFRAGQESDTSILITSPWKREGKTVTVANLAFALAQAGQPVAAVSADLRNPALHRYFGVADAPGLVEVMDGRASLDDALIVWSDNLSFLGSGAPSPGFADLLGSEAMKRVMGELSERSAFVIVDSPPVAESSDALTLSTMVGGVVLVARAKRTTRSEAAYARQQLDQVGARVIGCVLNMFNGRVAGQSLASDYRYAQPHPLGVVNATTPAHGDGSRQPTGRGVTDDQPTRTGGARRQPT